MARRKSQPYSGWPRESDGWKPPDGYFIRVVTEEEITNRRPPVVGKKILPEHCWCRCRIAETPGDPPDFPLYGTYYFQLLDGKWNPKLDRVVQEEVSRRMLLASSRSKLLALRAKLVSEVKL